MQTNARLLPQLALTFQLGCRPLDFVGMADLGPTTLSRKSYKLSPLELSSYLS